MDFIKKDPKVLVGVGEVLRLEAHMLRFGLMHDYLLST